MSIIHPPTRGIQSVQTQQITAAAGKYILKKHAISCQLLALTTVTPSTAAAITTGSADNSKVCVCFIFTVQIRGTAASCFLKAQSPRKQRRKFSLKHSFCWGLDNLKKTLLCNCCPCLLQTGLEMMVAIFNDANKCWGHGFRLKKARG